MKKSVWLVAVLAAGLALSYGCGSSSDDSSGGGGNSIVGTWVSDVDSSVVFTFSSNGGFSVAGEAGSWSTSGGNLTISGGGETITFTYSISGNTLTLGVPGSGTTTFHRA